MNCILFSAYVDCERQGLPSRKFEVLLSFLLAFHTFKRLFVGKPETGRKAVGTEVECQWSSTFQTFDNFRST